MQKSTCIQLKDFSITAENHICFINLSSPSTKNAISFETATHLKNILVVNPTTKTCTFEDFLSKEGVVLLVLQSEVEGIFSSGGNLTEFRDAKKETNLDYGRSVGQFCKFLNTNLIPSIAILEGNAYGGGSELALAPDFRWGIGNKIEFHFVQTRLGVPGGWGGMSRLSDLCPHLSMKKVNSIFMAREVLKYPDLEKMNLIDKSFLDKSSCLRELNRWRDSILACGTNLRDDFAKRLQYAGEELEKYDEKFFEKYFLTENHKKNILGFFKK